MGATGPAGLTLDAGALVAFERGDERVRALLRRARARSAPLTIPAGALARAWRDGARQARLAALVAESVLDPLDGEAAKAAGVLCGRRRVADVVDASVVVSARSRGDVVVTSDAGDLRRLSPRLAVAEV